MENKCEVPFRYNAQGQLVEQIRSDNQRQRYSYNNQGRLIEQIDIIGHTSRYVYDGVGNLIMFTDAESVHRIKALIQYKPLMKTAVDFVAVFVYSQKKQVFSTA